VNRRHIAYVVPVAALLAAATYVLVYLYRWEWHRALVAGVFMIALELGIGLAIVFEKLRAIEARMDAAERAALDATRRAVTDARPEPSEQFEWLKDAANRMSVFVPILLGAGVVLSALAWGVERLARLTARPTLERQLVLRLQPLTLPPGALLGMAPATLPARPHVAQPRSWRWLIVPLAVLPALVLGQTMDGLADATQNRPDTIVPGSAGRVVLQVENRNVASADEAMARSLWGACAVQIGTTYRLTGVELLDGGRVELRVRPAVGKYAERRLRGCFEDATTDLVRAEVLEVSTR
jgi:hypothetical protein